LAKAEVEAKVGGKTDNEGGGEFQGESDREA